MFVRAPDAALAFWAIEEALKCGAPAVVVGEIWNLKGYSLAASRRLLLAARKGRAPALLVLASAYGQADASRAPPRRALRSPLRRARQPRRRLAQTCPGHSPAGAALRRASRGRGPKRLFRLSTWGASSVSNGEART